jgi:uncharacterized protein YcbX
MAQATICALNVYPVKSCRGIALERAALSLSGIESDRRWMVISDTGRFLTQREVPKLALIVPKVDGAGLVLTAPDMPQMPVPVQPSGAQLEVVVWGDKCPALEVSGEVGAWLSEFLGRKTRLVRFDPEGVRRSDSNWTGGVETRNEFSDGFPLLIISEASLLDLDGRLHEPLPMNRFRPNIVIGGVEPYAEDRIKDLHSNGVRVRITKPCTRCIITTTDQMEGVKKGDEPLRTLKSYRYSKELRGLMFGMNAIVVDGAGSRLRVGQTLDIDWI